MVIGDWSTTEIELCKYTISEIEIEARIRSMIRFGLPWNPAKFSDQSDVLKNLIREENFRVELIGLDRETLGPI